MHYTIVIRKKQETFFNEHLLLHVGLHERVTDMRLDVGEERFPTKLENRTLDTRSRGRGTSGNCKLDGADRVLDRLLSVEPQVLQLVAAE